LNSVEAIVLGIVQGLTEFLPVSSSGHLVLFQNLFGLKEPELLFDICMHVGTLTAAIIVFYREILEILRALFQIPRKLKLRGGLIRLCEVDESIRMVLLIVVGSIPTVVIGLLFKEIINQLFGSITVVGLMLLVTGSLLWLTQNMRNSKRPVRETTFKDALLIGIAQGLAIIPGVSRSGVTISTALFLGVDRKLASRYSFLLSIPAICGALLIGLDTPELHTTIPMSTIVAGSVVSAIVGWIALVILLRIVKRGRLHIIAPYCWLVGSGTLLLALIG
jgi:undecaprenyl-diphosphatase